MTEFILIFFLLILFFYIKVLQTFTEFESKVLLYLMKSVVSL